MPKRYQIALDPALELDSDAFMNDWNASEDALKIGRVSITSADRGDFGFEAGVLILQTANTVAAGLLGKVLYDYIKAKYYVEEPKEPEVIIIPQEDGTKLIVVKTKE